MALVNKTFSDIITFTRASTATFFNSAGVLTSASNNVPRFDYDPATLAARGLLIEESRTNSIRNNTMVGAVAGTPGTLPTNWAIAAAGAGTLDRQVVGTGTVNGITYIDVRYWGTSSTTGLNIAMEPSTGGPAASSGQTWTQSNYVALVGGSLQSINAIRGASILGRDSGGVSTSDAFNSGDNKASLTSTLQRFSVTGTLANVNTATLQPSVNIAWVNGATDIDFTLRIGLPQLELGAFATSVIPTDNTLPLGKIRERDVASVNTLSPWYNASAGTVFSEWSILGVRSTNNQRIWSLSDGTNSQYIAVRVDSAAQIRGEQVGGSTIPITVLAVATANTVYKTGVAFEALNSATCLGGGTVNSNATFAFPTGINKLALGNLGTGSFELSGYLRRITYYPRRLANAELQSLTV